MTSPSIQIASDNSGDNGNQFQNGGNQPQTGGGGTTGGNTGGTQPTQPTWKNGVTKQTENGFPPDGWQLHSDGFWYPPQTTTGQTSTDLSQFIQIFPSINNIINLNYVQGVHSGVVPVPYTIRNLSNNMSINVSLSAIPALRLSRTQFSLNPNQSISFDVIINPVEADKLPAGLNTTDIIVQLTAGTILVPPVTTGGGFTTSSQGPITDNNPNGFVTGSTLLNSTGGTMDNSGGTSTTTTTGTGGPISIQPPAPPQLQQPQPPISIQPPAPQQPLVPQPPPPTVTPTWNNGLTKQTQDGMPPSGWTLSSDGFWYPPTVAPTPSNDFSFAELAPSFAQSVSTFSMNGTLSVIINNDDRTLYTHVWNFDVLNQGAGIMSGRNPLDFVGSWKLTPRDILNLQSNGVTTRTVRLISTKGSVVLTTQKVVTFTQAITGQASQTGPVTAIVGGKKVTVQTLV